MFAVPAAWVMVLCVSVMIADLLLWLLWLLCTCLWLAAELPHLLAVHLQHQRVHCVDLWRLTGQPVCEARRAGGSCSGGQPSAARR